MFDSYLKLLDYFIHPRAKQDIRRHIKIRGMISLGLIYLFTVLIVSPMSSTPKIIHLVLIVSLIMSFFAGKYTGWHEHLARVIIVILSAIVFFLLKRTGNLHTGVSFWVPAIVVAGLFAGGAVFGTILLLVLGSSIIALFYVEILPNIAAADAEAELRRFQQFILALLVIYAVAFIYEKANTVLIDLAEKRRKDLELQKQRTIEASHLSSLGEMAGGIAHEINNPLAIIRGNAEVLAKLTSHDAQARPRLDKIIATVERIQKIINSMRSLSRQDYEGDFQTENLANVIEEVLVFFKEKMRSLGYRIDVQLDASIEVNCQRVQIGQIIINLMNNAIDAIQEQKNEDGWIRLQLERRDAFAEISIANSGPTINEELASNLMRPFFTTKPVGKGTGLGLSISKHFAEQHGGQLLLDLSSEHTVFILRLPSQRPAQVVGF